MAGSTTIIDSLHPGKPVQKMMDVNPSYERRSRSRSPAARRERSRSRSPAVRRERSRSYSRSRSPRGRRNYSRSRSPVARYRSRSRSRSRDRYARDSRDRRGYGDRYNRYDRYDRRDDRGFDRRPREVRPVNRGSEEERAASKTLYFGNMPFTMQEREITDMLSKFGPIRNVSLPREGYDQRPRGFCFIEFEERRDAEAALAHYQGFNLEGRTLRVDWDVGRERKERPPRTDFRRDNYRRDDRRDTYRRDDRPDYRRDDRPDYQREERAPRDEYIPREERSGSLSPRSN